MIFQEKVTPITGGGSSFTYTLEDIFGDITITSGAKLDSNKLDQIVTGILQANVTVGNIGETISFVFNPRQQWDEEDKPVDEPANDPTPTDWKGPSGKSRAIAFACALFLGMLGIHRFYVRKNGTGLIMLLCTFSYIGLVVSVVWALFDAIIILFGGFTDKDGRRLANW